MIDDAAALRKGSSGTITATGNGSWVDFGGPDLEPRTYMVHAKTVSGTSPSMTVTIEESDDGSTVKDKVTMQAITAAGQYFVSMKSNARYRRASWVVSGTTPVFGAADPDGVWIGPVPGGRYKNW